MIAFRNIRGIKNIVNGIFFTPMCKINSYSQKFTSDCYKYKHLNLTYSSRYIFYNKPLQNFKSNFRFRSTQTKEQQIHNRTVMYYCVGFVMVIGGFTYSSVFLYRLYCQSTGKGGRAVLEESGERVAKMRPVNERIIDVKFNANAHSQMMWNFKPSQPLITIKPGETALAFYTAKNPTDKPITGIATYNVLPFEAGKYFNKIQCFCFEEQQLNPHEEVDMPVFFFLDPDYAEDPQLENIDEIMLSYTFFEAKEGIELPRPSFM